MGGYNPGGYPPPPPASNYQPASQQYRPQQQQQQKQQMPGYPPGPPPSSNFPPFPPGTGLGGYHNAPSMSPPSTYSPYDEYDPSSSHSSHGLPRKPRFGYGGSNNGQDTYDPYRPAAYDPGAPHIHGPTSGGYAPPPAPQQQTLRPSPRGSGTASHPPLLPLLLPSISASIGNYQGAVSDLPGSQLPITKYVSVNGDDAIDIHRALCQSGMAKSVWYAEASVRAGEGWGSAIEWVLETGMSGSKLRVCAGNTDSLETELSAILKATEGFNEQLQQSIRSAKPMSHEFVLFCSSPAAIVSIDTSSRPESIQFCRLWRSICTEFVRAHLTLVYLPPNSQAVEGYVLARKIADVASANSWIKRKKERTIEEVYNRPGGGEPAPGGSTEAGPWQRGDADPSRRKSPFERPKALSPVPDLPPPQSTSHSHTHSRSRTRTRSPQPMARTSSPRPQPHEEPEDEGIQPRAGALCVTNFPDDASAKDLGILFAEFGDIQSVDIFSIPPVRPRFAFVAYSNPAVSIPAATAALHQKSIQLSSPFAVENAADLAIWRGWNGVLTVVESDPDRLVPLTIAQDFRELPDYATNSRRESSSGVKRERETPSTYSPPPGPGPSPKRAKPHISQPDVKPDVKPVLPPYALGLADGKQPIIASPTLNGQNSHASSHPHGLSSTPLTASTPIASTQPAAPSPATTTMSSSGKPPLTNSAAEPQEFPIQLSSKTLRAQLNLVQNVFVKHDTTNWIAHTCLIATDLDQARRSLQADLYATDEAFLNGRELESTLLGRGFTGPRVDTFITKVLKVLDGIALADEIEAGGPPAPPTDDVPASTLAAELARTLESYPEQTREAMSAAGKVLEYLDRGKQAQEKKRLDVERRVGVLEGMVKIGEQVSSVVRYLLADDE